MKRLAIILARKGSLRLPGKNTKMLAGMPLISYTVEEAIKSNKFAKIAISTNDSKIIEFANNVYADKVTVIERPYYLCTDNAPPEEAVLHAIDYLGANNFDTVCLLQPTSPLRTAEHIIESIMYADSIENSCYSAVKIGGEFRPNGAIYYVPVKELTEKRKFNFELSYVMPESESIDIDTIEDFRAAEKYIKERRNAIKT